MGLIILLRRTDSGSLRITARIHRLRRRVSSESLRATENPARIHRLPRRMNGENRRAITGTFRIMEGKSEYRRAGKN